jgi:hypothetical protein
MKTIPTKVKGAFGWMVNRPIVGGTIEVDKPGTIIKGKHTATRYLVMPSGAWKRIEYSA